MVNDLYCNKTKGRGCNTAKNLCLSTLLLHGLGSEHGTFGFSWQTVTFHPQAAAVRDYFGAG